MVRKPLPDLDTSLAAIEDVTRYQECLLGLLRHNDDKGLRLLGIYLAAIAAIVTAGFALMSISLLTPALAGFLVGTAASLGFGCIFAYVAAWRADIYLPGRRPDFWRWAIDNKVNVRHALSYYLDQADICITHNDRINKRAARMLSRGYLCGLSAPWVGGAVALVVTLTRCLTS